MHPILFEIPGLGFPIRSFGVTVAAGIFLAIWLWGKLLQRHGDDPTDDPLRGSQVAIWIVVGVLAGARMMYVTVESARYLSADLPAEAEMYLDAEDRGAAAGILLGSNPEALGEARRVAVGYDFLHDPLKLVMIWQGGLVMYGGMIGGILFAILSCKKHGLRVWNSLDTGMVCAFLGLAIGRWGCLLVGDDYGRVVSEAYTDLGFPLTITVPSAAWLSANPESLFGIDLAGKTLWATQVWMSVNAMLVAGLGYLVVKRRRWMGQAAAVMVIHYSITRFLVEMFRGDEIRGVWFDGLLSTSQLVSIIGLGVGIALLVKRPGPALTERSTGTVPVGSA